MDSSASQKSLTRLNNLANAHSPNIKLDSKTKEFKAYKRIEARDVNSAPAEREHVVNAVLELLADEFGAFAANEAKVVFADVLRKGGAPLGSHHVAQALTRAENYADRLGKQEDRLPYGLSALQAKKKRQHYIATSGIKYESGAAVGRFVYIKAKEKGVEPGFVGKKRFTRLDHEKMLDLNHKFSIQAAQYLLEALQDESSDCYKAVALKFAHLSGVSTRAVKMNNFKAALSAYVASKNAADLTAEDADLFNSLKRDVPDRSSVGSRFYVGKAMRDAVVTTQPKFKTPHYIKLDYKEEDRRMSMRGRGHLVQIPKELAKGTIHRKTTAKSVRDANWGAVRECMANDLMRSMGIYSQKLRILESRYESGEKKLLLDGAHMTGPNGESFEDFSGKIKDGYLVDQNGKVDTTIEDLGKYLIYFLLMADRDAIGSRGDNKGRVGNLFAAIDPGHSLEVGEGKFTTDLMAFHNVHDDFSFDQPTKVGDKLTKGYKNFTIFQDRPYLEKFKGVLEMRALRETGEDLSVIDTYIEAFAYGDVDFKQELHAVRNAYIARRDYILDTVFGERLQVYDTDPAAGPAALNFVDKLEKLTSKTSLKSPHGEVDLNYLRVEERSHWFVKYDNDSKTYILESKLGKAGDADLAKNFLQSAGLKAPDVRLFINEDTGALTIKVLSTAMVGVNEVCSDDLLKGYKKIVEANLAYEA